MIVTTLLVLRARVCRSDLRGLQHRSRLHLYTFNFQLRSPDIRQRRAKRFFERLRKAVKMYLRNATRNRQRPIVADSIESLSLCFTELAGQYERELVRFHPNPFL
jgi:hypothetical protein